jgi:hypothetical protein
MSSTLSPGRQTPLLLAHLLLLATGAAAQIVDQGAIPACARGAGCAIWQQAQQLCAPPTTPAPDRTCFCNSNYLAPFRAGQAAGVCDVVCPPADQKALQAYFQSFCAPNAKAATPTPAAGGGGPATVTEIVTVDGPGPTAKTTTAGGPPTGVPVSHAAASGPPAPSWISSHWGWVVMVVVLLLAAGAGIWGGLFLKRRRRRLRAADPTTLRASDVAPALANRHPDALVARHGGAQPLPPPPPTPSREGGYPSVTDLTQQRSRAASAASARGYVGGGGGGGGGGGRPFSPAAGFAPRPPFGAAGVVSYAPGESSGHLMSEEVMPDAGLPRSRPGTSQR